MSIAALSLPLDPVALIPLRVVHGFCFAARAQSLFLHFSRHAPEECRSSSVGAASSFLLIGQSAGPLLAGPLVGLMPVAAAVLVMTTARAIAGLFALASAQRENSADDAELDEEADAEETTQLPVVGAMNPARPSTNGVGLAPFRGWRVAPERLRDLAGRYATPWDQHAGAWDGSAEEAASVLRSWQRSGALVREPARALYAYEQTGPRGAQRGLLAAVHLDSRLLPHEDVIPSRANGIGRVLEVGRLNLEPLLLGYSGGGRTAAHLDAATRRTPASEVLASDGQRHRLWRITDQAAHSDITTELSRIPAFLADGHHRWVAARQLRRCLHADGRGAGPWDYISGLLVDVQRSPMALSPVHRLLPHVNPTAALNSAATRFRIARLRGGLIEWLRVLRQNAQHAIAFVLVTGREAFLLPADRPAPGFRGRRTAPGSSGTSPDAAHRPARSCDRNALGCTGFARGRPLRGQPNQGGAPGPGVRWHRRAGRATAAGGSPERRHGGLEAAAQVDFVRPQAAPRSRPPSPRRGLTPVHATCKNVPRADTLRCRDVGQRPSGAGLAVAIPAASTLLILHVFHVRGTTRLLLHQNPTHPRSQR
ncbi:DUF1015 family protein [Saccharopolyspora spinosa]|uniref:DUF1015 family protein n=1 Tax=Saccharopolyspora spinosa TaxID=60894 RepID=UPI0002FAF8F4